MVARLACWQRIPLDAKGGYIAVSAFALGFGLSVMAGPDLLVWLTVAFLLLALLIVLVILAAGLAFRQGRRRRILPFLLVSSCLIMHYLSPSASVNLHLILHIYLAGGPNNLSDWAQGLIREQSGKPNDTLELSGENIPPGVRRYLGHPTVGGALRFEFGGGFYHYGVVVSSRDNPPPPEWWQGILGWPAEVVIYHES